jgi:chemotaxis protein CheX
MNQDIKSIVFRDKLLPAMIESTRQAFETMAFMPTQFGELQLNQTATPHGDISGTIGVSGSIALTGDILCGNLSLIFPDPIANAVFRSMMMMGEEDPVSQQEVVDAVGELANMCAGGAKAAMQDIGIHFLISLPSVVIGTNHCLSRPANSVSGLIPVHVAKGTFYLEVNFSWR